jgi:fructosamine-3-kinase
VSNRLESAVEKLIEEKTGRPARVATTGAAGGGCINDARVVRLEDGRRYFLKSNPHPLPGMFPREAEGLEALANVGAIRVPRPVGTGGEEEGEIPFIVMEYVSGGSPKNGFHETFGRRFALLHLQSRQDRFGFDRDNYLGSTPQPNSWKDNWVEFWREHRLGFQLDLARRNRLSDPDFDRRGKILLDRLDELIGEPEEPACLLHGDLWGGNYLADSEGEPVLIDPAAYYGRREADLAMTMLFGGFGRDFYSAYEEAWPLAEGSETRLEVYKLYHLLNHLNLFGGSYYSGCIGILRRYT